MPEPHTRLRCVARTPSPYRSATRDQYRRRMPSSALTTWTGDRSQRLDRLEQPALGSRQLRVLHEVQLVHADQDAHRRGPAARVARYVVDRGVEPFLVEADPWRPTCAPPAVVGCVAEDHQRPTGAARRPGRHTRRRCRGGSPASCGGTDGEERPGPLSTLVSRWSMSRVSRPPTAQLRPAWGRLLRRVRG